MGRADLPFEAKVNVVYCELRGLSKYWLWKQPLRTTSTREGVITYRMWNHVQEQQVLAFKMHLADTLETCLCRTEGNVSCWGNKTNTNVITKLFSKAPGFFVHHC